MNEYGRIYPFYILVGLSAEGKTDELFSTKDSNTCFFVEETLPLMNSQWIGELRRYGCIENGRK